MSYTNWDSAAKCATEGALMGNSLRMPTINEQVAHRINDLNAQLAELNELKALLEKNPEFERMLTLARNKF